LACTTPRKRPRRREAPLNSQAKAETDRFLFDVPPKPFLRKFVFKGRTGPLKGESMPDSVPEFRLENVVATSLLDNELDLPSIALTLEGAE